MKGPNFQEIDKKWQKYWESQGIHRAQEDSPKPKLYVLDMFPYPSGEGLHVGHVEGYTATDIYSRYQRMKGHNVLHPIGWDAFGLPAENYAVKTGVHPRETTEKAAQTFRSQIQSLGLSYDWSREIGTHTSAYYKWTQWFFLLLYKNNLAYRAKAFVSWCPSCKTVLANEQVVNGLCDRCKSEVVQKELEQWFFKITEFAEELVSDLDQVDWPESTKLNQRNWIGRSEGAELDFSLEGRQEKIRVFTTRPDTLFGATYLVVSPEHELVGKFLDGLENKEEVKAYLEETKKKTELERTKEKTGVELKGIKAINPANQEAIPVFVADYVLVHYGTGAIMAVPAHDERDFEFAKKYGLPVRRVIEPEALQPFSPKRNYPIKEVGWQEIRIESECWTGEGTLVQSGAFNGISSQEARAKITEFVRGEKRVSYKLRDWLVSRQRYWGAPIPIVYDPEGKAHPIPEEHLPWMLPTDVEFKPTGVSPLAESQELKERTETIFGKGWYSEVDTMDTFVCSSWYYFRFADPHNREVFASKQALEKWLPVDVYMGGAEHTVLHLMYARFFTKVLQKLGYVNFSEPFLKLRHQGLILAEDGKKMSKSLGNVINPDTVVAEFGADAARIYEMFMGPLEYAKPWSTTGIIGVKRLLDKVWRLRERVGQQDNPDLKRIIHQTIKKVGEDIESFGLNTAISQLMICANEMEKAESMSRESFELFLKTFAPFAPHLTEELWHELGNEESIHLQPWPEYSEELIQEETVKLVLQVNGRVRDAIEVPTGLSEKEAKERALQSEKIQKWIEGKKVQQVIVIPGKLVNIVCAES